MTTMANDYIADGFMHDCEELIYSLTNDFDFVDYHKFCFYWKEREYDTLFYGRTSGPEVVEFTEEALQVARLYFVTKTGNYEEQVVGLFIINAILTIQPYRKLVSLRLVPEDVPVINEFEATARRDKRHDVLMILGKVLITSTQFHAALRERALDPSIKKYYDASTRVPEFTYKRWHGILNKKLMKTFEDIDATETMYALSKKMVKMKIKSHFPGTNVKIDMDTKNIAKPTSDSLSILLSGDKAPESSEDMNANSIKARAMMSSVDPMRHLYGIDERKHEKEETPEPEPKSRRYKRKYVSRKKSSAPDPKIEEEVNEILKGFALPDLDYLAKRSCSPEELFRGFPCNGEQKNDSPLPNDSGTKTKDKGKGKGKGNSPNNNKKGSKSEDDGSIENPGSSHWNARTLKTHSHTKAKKQIKNIHNMKIKFTEFSDADSVDISQGSTDESDTEKIIEPLVQKSKETGVRGIDDQDNEAQTQSKGIVKEFVDFQVQNMPLIISTGSEPVEIEVIDEYRGTNDHFEEMCEISEDDDSGPTKSAGTSKTPGLRKTAEKAAKDKPEDDDMEVFEVCYNDDQIPNREVFYEKFIDDTKVQEAFEKVLNKDLRKNVNDRRKLKQPNLRSKLKKMGILPVADFDDESS